MKVLVLVLSFFCTYYLLCVFSLYNITEFLSKVLSRCFQPPMPTCIHTPHTFFFSSHPAPKHTQILNLWVRFDAQLKFMTFKRVLVILTSKHILSQLSGVPFNTKPRRIMFLSPSRMITCFKVFLKRREIIWRRPVSSLSVVMEKSVCCSYRTQLKKIMLFQSEHHKWEVLSFNLSHWLR